jgi:hemin uptake protein HemP
MNQHQSLAMSAESLPVLESEQLFAWTREVRIHHCGQQYRLRLTGNNKLILTK